jgi:hypothetical protein
MNCIEPSEKKKRWCLELLASSVPLIVLGDVCAFDSETIVETSELMSYSLATRSSNVLLIDPDEPTDGERADMGVAVKATSVSTDCVRHKYDAIT